jgi:hypothetical protein
MNAGFGSEGDTLYNYLAYSPYTLQVVFFRLYRRENGGRLQFFRFVSMIIQLYDA